MAIKELFALFTFDVDKASLAKAEKATDGVKKAASDNATKAKSSLVEIGKTLTAVLAGGAIKAFIEGQIEAGSVLRDTADKLGVGTDELQAFTYATGLSGVSAEGAANALKFLSKNVGGALGGGEAAKTFTALGVSLKNTDGSARELGDLLPELADSFKKMGSQEERTAKAMEIFGKSGSDIVPFLMEGADGVNALYKEFNLLGGGLSNRFIDAADKAGDEISKLTLIGNSLKSELAAEILPTLTEWVKAFQGVAVSALKLVRSTNILKGVLGVAAGTGLILGIGRFQSLAAAFGFVAKEGSGLLGSLRALLGFTLRFAGIALAIAGLVLIIDDLYTMFNGGRSVIAEWLDNIYGVGTAKKVITETTTAVESLGKMFQPVTDALGFLRANAVPIFTAIAKIVGGVLATAVEGIVTGFDAIVLTIKQLIASFETLRNIGTKSAKALGLDSVANFIGGSDQKENAAKASQDSADKAFRNQVRNLSEAAGFTGQAFGEFGKATDPANDVRRFENGYTLPTQRLGGVGLPLLPQTLPGIPLPTSPGAGPFNANSTINITVPAGENAKDTAKEVAKGTSEALDRSLRNSQAALRRGP